MLAPDRFTNVIHLPTRQELFECSLTGVGVGNQPCQGVLVGAQCLRPIALVKWPDRLGQMARSPWSNDPIALVKCPNLGAQALRPYIK